MYGDVLGVDIGGVILRTNEFETLVEVPDALDVLRALQDKFERIILVSRANPGWEERVLLWRNYRRFWEYTGIPQQNVFFCRERKEKVPICIRERVTHFADDRTEVLEYLWPEIKNLYLFQGRPEEMEPRAHILKHVVQVDSWKALARELMG